MSAKAEGRAEFPHVSTVTDTKGRRRGMRVSDLLEFLELYRGLSPEGQRRVIAEAVALANRAKATGEFPQLAKTDGADDKARRRAKAVGRAEP